MPKTDGTGSGWRARSADRENKRRQRAYDDAVEAWRLRNDELRRMRAAAAEFRGSVDVAAGLPVELHPDEVVFCVLPAAQLAEAPHVTSLPAPDLTVIPVSVAALRPRLPDGIRATDAGTAVVTDRRVVFQSRRCRREWPYAKMTGLAHASAAPLTLMRVLNRQTASGLLLPPASVPGFRLNLILAFADAIEQRAAVVAQLDEAIAAHQSSEPSAPDVVTADQVSLTALIPVGKLTVAAAVATALLVPAVALRSGPPAGSQAEAAAAATPASTQPVVAVPTSASTLSRPTASPTSQATTTAAAKVLPGTNSPRPTRATGSPTPKKEHLCGAPANPYGYNFCGGSRIYRPASGVCDYFDCVANFWSGRGYLILCRDGTVSMSGGRPESCTYHGANRRTVYA